MIPFAAGLAGAYGLGLIIRATMFDHAWQYLDGLVMLLIAVLCFASL